MSHKRLGDDRIEDSSEPISSSVKPAAQQRVAIIGAGPIGLECAHYALRCGFSMRLFEAAAEIAPNIRSWQHVELYSPWRQLRTPLGDEAVKGATSQMERPARATLYPTAEEFLRRYLDPLAAALPAKAIWLGSRVVAVTKPYLCVDHTINHDPLAGSDLPIRLLTRNSITGEERTWSAEYVLDCTCGGRVPAWIGPGGIPAIGEMGSTHLIHRRIPDILGKNRSEFAGKKTLLIGDGTSAATSVNLLSELAESHEGTQIFWAVNHDRALPCHPLCGAELSARRSLALSKANLLVKAKRPYIAYSNRTFVEEIRYNYEAKKFFVTLQVNRQTKRYQFDNVVANVGSRRESLYVNELSPIDPGFFVLGSSDCTCDDHLIRRGLGEIRDAFRRITGDHLLDLYGFDKA
jgi:hypothetical protein